MNISNSTPPGYQGVETQMENNENVFKSLGEEMMIQHRPRYFFCIPKLFRFDDSVEATAIAVDNFARAVILMGSVFISTALLELAKEQAINDSGCDENDAYCSETARVHGFLPSSLLTNISTIAGIFSAITLPLIGAIIDHTNHRRMVGLYSALGMSLIKVIEIGISSNTWFFIAILQLVSPILFQLLTVTEYAYGAELSSLPQQQSKYQSHFFLCQFISLISFLIQVLVTSKIKQFDDIQTAKFGALLSTAWTTPLFYLTWQSLFPRRQALHRIPPDQTLFSAGFTKLYKTYQRIKSDLPAVYSFLQSSIYCEGANWAINTVAITYFKEFLGLSTQKIGLVIMVLLIGGIPGTFLGKHISLQYGPVTSSKVCLIVFILVISGASSFLTPATNDFVFVFSFFLGVCKGT
jgi:MFS-type transporter involved in bile tolerance (Atg22 family)